MDPATKGGFLRRFSIRLRPRQQQVAPPSPNDSSDDEDDVRPALGKDKHWAQRYINDPLTAPEPSQETGPGSSFTNSRNIASKPRTPSSDNKGKQAAVSGYPSPPNSASPTRRSFHPSNPFSVPSRPESPGDLGSDELKLLKLLELDSVAPLGSASYPRRHKSQRPPHHTPLGLHRTSTVRSQPSMSNNPFVNPVSRSQSISSRHSAPRRSPNTNAGSGIRRNASLRERYPGDMSIRPLDQIKRETRAADRAPHLKKNTMARPDTIDSLDNVLGVYHHDGPYDAALAARNVNKKYAPIEAVKDSNLEAIKATPREYVQDSLDKHVPLQGTATVPPGMTDFSGRRMSYEEGTDVMRDPDAPGGPYRRYDFVPYHPDDLKGKGEPSYTYERDKKESKQALEIGGVSGTAGVYEMQPGGPDRQQKNGGTTTRQRAVSAARDGAGPSGSSNDTDLGRSHSTSGKRLSDGLKRRFDHLKRKAQSAGAEE